MSSYTQRFLKNRRYFSDLSEDVLAITLCLPFTFALRTWNNLAELLPEISWLPRDLDAKIWNIGRFLLTLPLFFCKGILNLTLVPVLASLIAFNSWLPRSYSFPVGREFERWIRHFWKRYLAIRLLQNMGFTFYDLFPSPFPLLLIVTAWLGAGQLQLHAIFLLNMSQALGLLLATAVYIQPWVDMFLSLPLKATLLSSTIAFTLWLEGKTDPIEKLLSRFMYQLCAKIEYIALKFGISPKKLYTIENRTEGVSLEEIDQISPENIFISNTNHAFDLQSLEGNVTRQGLQNYYFERETKKFDSDDVLRLEQHPRVRSGQFPLLRKYIAEHKQEYIKSTNKVISEESLRKLDALAHALMAAQDARDFAENLFKAKESLDAHLEKISPEEKNAILSLNTLGGNSEEYMLKNVLSEVYKPESEGGWCKKDNGRFVQDTSNRVRNNVDEENAPQVFWQRAFPTHWGLLVLNEAERQQLRLRLQAIEAENASRRAAMRAT